MQPSYILRFSHSIQSTVPGTWVPSEGRLVCPRRSSCVPGTLDGSPPDLGLTRNVPGTHAGGWVDESTPAWCPRAGDVSPTASSPPSPARRCQARGDSSAQGEVRACRGRWTASTEMARQPETSPARTQGVVGLTSPARLAINHVPGTFLLLPHPVHLPGRLPPSSRGPRGRPPRPPRPGGVAGQPASACCPPVSSAGSTRPSKINHQPLTINHPPTPTQSAPGPPPQT